MMPIAPKPEPADFDALVRQPGLRFLAQYPIPTVSQFNNHRYWHRILQSLHELYDGICAYSCHWIPYDTGADTVEHFLPKSLYPDQAHEWNNYRLVCATLNGRKGVNAELLDPFTLQNGWFVLDFPSMLIQPARGLDRDLVERVVLTRDLLGLNDEGTCLKSRLRYVLDYCNKDITYAFLVRNAPFIAQQLAQHGLEDLQLLREVMGYV